MALARQAVTHIEAADAAIGSMRRAVGWAAMVDFYHDLDGLMCTSLACKGQVLCPCQLCIELSDVRSGIKG